MIEILISLAPFGVLITLGGVAIYLWYRGEQKRRKAQETKWANDLQQLKDVNHAQANPVADAKRANKLVRSRKDS